MSKSRVKRSYDSFCLGDDQANTMMMTSSPQCSPLRCPPAAAMQTIGNEIGNNNLNQQMQEAAAPTSSAASSSSSSSSSSFNSFSNFNFQPTFSSLTPASSSSSSSSSSSLPSSSPPPSYVSTPLVSASKRVRRDVNAMEEEEVEEATQRHQQGKHESPFQRLKRPHNIDDLMFVPRSYKKQAIAAALSGPSSSSHATPVAAPPLPGIIPPPPSSNPQVQLPNYHHQLFTYDQVASIVKNALDMREEQIREEYNRTLQELLREQFENFSSFNRDYISRNMKARDQEEGGEDWENSYYS